MVYRGAKLSPTATAVHAVPLLRGILMSELLKLLLFNVFVIIGVHFVTREDQLLGKVGDQIRKLPEMAAKPIAECPPCMSSAWGTLIFWTFWHEGSFQKRLLLWPLYLLALCGQVRLINLILKAVKKEAE